MNARASKRASQRVDERLTHAGGFGRKTGDHQAADYTIPAKASFERNSPNRAIRRRTSCASSRYCASCARLHVSILEPILFAPLARANKF